MWLSHQARYRPTSDERLFGRLGDLSRINRSRGYTLGYVSAQLLRNASKRRFVDPIRRSRFLNLNKADLPDSAI
jgi:hypothetical protein